MNLHTNFKAKPGVYRHNKWEGFFIMKTIVTHSKNPDNDGADAMLVPLVIVEPMMQDINSHKAYAFSEEDFLAEFHQV